MNTLLPFLAAALVGLAACSSTDTPDNANLPATTLDVDAPVLTARGLGKGWEQQWQTVSNDGQSYEIRYRHQSDPFEQLVIYGSTKPLPKMTKPPVLTTPSRDGLYEDDPGIKTPQSWKSTRVMGQTVRWYQEDVADGADGSYYSTEGFSLTSPEGKTGYYRLVIESVTGAAPARFSKVGW
ncbi:hypothetical protein [Roseibacillus persicicus]|uniref:hypothetical protein n=1 Tax=Roseibacillus persicicus TaxID=454148 RepID=UPI00280F1B86|nr:hypothetical protein [Roseibacillus persicicus]MDQ8189259.1 hypothetical protein [Roseibacillus persicicus]